MEVTQSDLYRTSSNIAVHVLRLMGQLENTVETLVLILDYREGKQKQSSEFYPVQQCLQMYSFIKKKVDTDGSKSN